MLFVLSVIFFVFLEKQIKILTVLGCRKLTYYAETEPKINTLSEELTLKISSESVCSSYLFGFNGKENDNEVKGEGNSYDFGARIYDSRLGRWLSLDPSEAKYPGLSPYVFSYNSPLIFKDPDGKDGRITIVENENGGTITLESTIHVYGKNAKIAVDNANAKFAMLNNKSEFVDANGKKWTVELKVKWEQDQYFDKLGKVVDNISEKEVQDNPTFKNGDNILQVGVPEGGAQTGFLGLGAVGGREAFSYGADAFSVVQESLHTLGLRDAYSGCCTPNKGFERDVMSIGDKAGNEMNKSHLINLGKMALSKFDYYKNLKKDGFDLKYMKVQDENDSNKYTFTYRDKAE